MGDSKYLIYWIYKRGWKDSFSSPLGSLGSSATEALSDLIQVFSVETNHIGRLLWWCMWRPSTNWSWLWFLAGLFALYEGYSPKCTFFSDFNLLFHSTEMWLEIIPASVFRENEASEHPNLLFKSMQSSKLRQIAASGPVKLDSTQNLLSRGTGITLTWLYAD